MQHVSEPAQKEEASEPTAPLFAAPPPATTPSAPATLTITSLGTQVCGRPRYRYTAPAVLPAATATAGAATGYQWSFYGTLGATFVVDSGSLSTSVVTGYFTSTAARAAGDSVKVRYASTCGFGAYKVVALTNVASSTSFEPHEVVYLFGSLLGKDDTGQANKLPSKTSRVSIELRRLGAEPDNRFNDSLIEIFASIEMLSSISISPLNLLLDKSKIFNAYRLYMIVHIFSFNS